MRQLTIVVGTGRCGSTMLSDALGADDRVLSLSEFFVCLSPLAFAEGTLTGAHFWRILAGPRLKPNTLIRYGVPAPEFRYLDLPGRFGPGDIPAVSLVTLPGLTADPDALYDELAAEVPRWPSAPVGDHYRRLFDRLCVRFGRSVVVERSGGSLRFLPELIELFPEARFVHIHRAGPDCAVSMSRHPSFRLAVLISRMRPYLGVDPFHAPSAAHGEVLPEPLRRFLPDRFDGLALATTDIPVAEFGALWSHQMVTGFAHLAALDQGRLLTMAYEDILADPEHELARFARYAGLAEPDEWARTRAPAVDTTRAGAAAGLAPSVRAELSLACRPGSRTVRQLAGQGVAR